MKGFEGGTDQASIASVTERVRAIAIGASVASVHFLSDRAAFVGAEEGVSIADGEGELSKIEICGGGILCAASDGARIVMGTDDGRLVALDANGGVSELERDPKRRWIDNVALHTDGAHAWSVGKTAFVRSGKGEAK